MDGSPEYHRERGLAKPAPAALPAPRDQPSAANGPAPCWLPAGSLRPPSPTGRSNPSLKAERSPGARLGPVPPVGPGPRREGADADGLCPGPAPSHSSHEPLTRSPPHTHTPAEASVDPWGAHVPPLCRLDAVGGSVGRGLGGQQGAAGNTACCSKLVPEGFSGQRGAGGRGPLCCLSLSHPSAST